MYNLVVMESIWQKCKWPILAVIGLFIINISCISIPIGEPQISTHSTSPPPPTPQLTLPVINSFIASPEIVTAGQTVTLRWNVIGADHVTIQPTYDKVEPMGSIDVSPQADTAFTLIATNKTGSVTSFVIITVKSSEIPASQQFVGVDPVTGRNADVVFELEQLCLSTDYQVQIAKDTGFTLMVFDSGIYRPSSSTSPAMLYLAGGRLEAGHTYYWRARVRQATTGQAILGPWSYPKQFTIGAGFPVVTPYLGIHLFSPVNSCCSYPIKSVPFSWSPYQATTKYRFILAKDPGLTNIVTVAEVPTTAYVYEGSLDYNTSYFWQVTAMQPAPSDPSPVFTFYTEAKPEPASVAPAEVIPEEEPMPPWVLAVIGIGLALLIIVIVLVFIVRR
jgi:hypothetical protein